MYMWTAIFAHYVFRPVLFLVVVIHTMVIHTFTQCKSICQMANQKQCTPFEAYLNNLKR